jgi:urea transport system permease protein
MEVVWRHACAWLVGAFCALSSLAASALNVSQLLSAVEGESDARIAAINQIATSGHERAASFLSALAQDKVAFTASAVFIVADDGAQARDAITNASLKLPADAQSAIVNNRLRGEIETALASMSLVAGDLQARLKAAKTLAAEPAPEKREMIERALAKEQDRSVKAALTLALASIDLTATDSNVRIQAAQALGQSKDVSAKTLLQERLRKDGDAFVEPEAAVRAAIESSVRAIDDALAWGPRIGAIFSGVSLGSILLLAALGLAITYGLMGVINMAHGELIMIGAYATYLTQLGFRKFFPAAFDLYPIAAIPVAFAAAALVGIAMERLVIRHLYNRPLETLLATWGVSLVLIQLVRTLFGAQNVPVENPTWMSGGITVFSGTVLPYNRIAVIVFAALVVTAVALVIAKTRLGLFVRGVTQNRTMAACVGVNTRRVDMMAFAFGSGIAGLAGCALAQLGNVGPDLGQSTIIDSFMVVVVGGVGQLTGTVLAALGLGVLNKGLEGFSGAVLAKIAVLVLIIVFIQKRPHGLFAFKGRSAD